MPQGRLLYRTGSEAAMLSIDAGNRIRSKSEWDTTIKQLITPQELRSRCSTSLSSALFGTKQVIAKPT